MLGRVGPQPLTVCPSRDSQFGAGPCRAQVGHHPSTTWCRLRVLMKDGEPHFLRVGTAYWVAAAGRPPEGRSLGRDSSPVQAKHLNASVLSEVVVEGEGSRNVTGVEHGERDRVTQRPVLVGVPRQDLLRFLLFGGESRHDRQPARQEPLASNALCRASARGVRGSPLRCSW